MNELIAKLKETGNKEAFNSQEEFTAAAKSLGFSDEDINAAVGAIIFPLSDDDLENVAGGGSSGRPRDDYYYWHYVACQKCNCQLSEKTIDVAKASEDYKRIKSNPPACQRGGVCEPISKKELGALNY